VVLRVRTILLTRDICLNSHPSVQVIDAVSGACSQICVHLSDSLYDMVLNMIFDYASNNVRSNAVRAIHQLVECVANANPEKTLAKFFYFCERNIRTELENGASSLRTTTSSSAPLPSDATLHWSKFLINPWYQVKMNASCQTSPFSGVQSISELRPYTLL
jgi:hypothetical protein